MLNGDTMNDVMNVMSIIGTLVLIVLILVLTYFASRWYARRMGVSGGGRLVKILDRTSLGQSSSLIVVQVAEKYFLIGVSEKNMQMLCELEDFAQYIDGHPPADSPAASFKDLLNGLMNRPGKKVDGGTQ